MIKWVRLKFIADVTPPNILIVEDKVIEAHLMILFMNEYEYSGEKLEMFSFARDLQKS